MYHASVTHLISRTIYRACISKRIITAFLQYNQRSAVVLTIIVKHIRPVLHDRCVCLQHSAVCTLTSVNSLSYAAKIQCRAVIRANACYIYIYTYSSIARILEFTLYCIEYIMSPQLERGYALNLNISVGAA